MAHTRMMGSDVCGSKALKVQHAEAAAHMQANLATHVCSDSGFGDAWRSKTSSH